MLKRMWSKENTPPLLVGVQNYTVILETKDFLSLQRCAPTKYSAKLPNLYTILRILGHFNAFLKSVVNTLVSQSTGSQSFLFSYLSFFRSSLPIYSVLQSLISIGTSPLMKHYFSWLILDIKE